MVSEAEKKRMRETYDYNESVNYHRENNIMLINAFGTKSEKEKAKKLDAVIEKRGEGMTIEESNWFYNHGSKKYYKRLL